MAGVQLTEMVTSLTRLDPQEGLVPIPVTDARAVQQKQVVQQRTIAVGGLCGFARYHTSSVV
jgi:hypothetical protein